ncbi:MAG: 3D domain-containing protein [Muribaculaceae bacterium]|nr:3D domain-containing protein [Muribaculaceae bacterium]
MTEAAKRRARDRARLIRVQWLVILILFVALLISLLGKPGTATVEPETEGKQSISQTVSEVITETVEPPEPALPPKPPEAPELIELGEFKTTAYCTCVKCCGVWSQEHPSRVGTDYVQKTASGTIPTEDRTVSVDTEIIPFGTVLVIDGHEYIAEDTGSAIKGNIIDIYFSSHEAACEYGVQYKTIYVKGE